MRFRVKNQGPEATVLRLEPQGSEYQLLPGDYYEFEWKDAPGPLIGTIEYEPDAITISEGNGPARMWDSRGEEISTLG